MPSTKWSGISPPEERRSAPRVEAVGQITISGNRYNLVNWSVNGALLAGYTEFGFTPDQRYELLVEVTDALKPDDGQIKFRAEAQGVTLQDGCLALRFILVEETVMARVLSYFVARGWLDDA
jgi:hypothetical protein